MNEFTVAQAAARAAGEVLRRQYPERHQRRVKPDDTLVSDADLAAEKTIITTIATSFPHHAIFSEEAGIKKTNSDQLWIIDPLDGSTNYLHHLGNFCVSIALVLAGQPRLGVIYLPLTDELFAAESGQAATLNDQPISPSATGDVRQALIGFGRSSVQAPRHAHIYQALTSHIRSSRLIGSTLIHASYAADGRIDALVGSDCKLYDIIAGAIIARSAGAAVTDFSGQPWQPDCTDPTSTSDVLIANQVLGAALVTVLSQNL